MNGNRIRQATVSGLLLLGTCLYPGTSASQTPRLNPDRLAEFMGQLAEARERLQLTPEQEQQVRPILREDFTRRLTLLEAYGFGSGSRPQLSLREARSLRQDLDAVTSATSDQLDDVLSEEQMEEFEKLQAEARDRVRERIRTR